MGFEENLQENLFNPLIELYGKEKIYIPGRELYCRDIVFPIYVRLKEVTVTNEDGKSHKIKDLVFKVISKIELTAQGCLFRIIGIKAVRLTVTRAEYESGYSHSHLPSGHFREWLEPCFGSFKEVKQHPAFLIGCLTYTANEDGTISDNYEFIPADLTNLFNYMILVIKELEDWVSVESLSGGPYIRISDIKAKGEELSLIGLLNAESPINNVAKEYIDEAVECILRENRARSSTRVYLALNLEDSIKQVYKYFYTRIIKGFFRFSWRWFEDAATRNGITIKKVWRKINTMEGLLPLLESNCLMRTYNTFIGELTKDRVTINNDKIYIRSAAEGNNFYFYVDWNDNEKLNFTVVDDESEDDNNIPVYALHYAVQSIVKHLAKTSRLL